LSAADLFKIEELAFPLVSTDLELLPLFFYNYNFKNIK
jgi:hypothetical protein